MSDDLVKMARLAQRDERMSTGALYGDLADRIEELETKLAVCEKYRDDLTKKIHKLVFLLDDQLGTPCEQIRHQQQVEELEGKLAKAVEALDGVMVGGNHLAVWLPDDHPPAEVEPLAALEKIGAGVSFDVWCCWRSIMQARTTLAELKGDDPE